MKLCIFKHVIYVHDQKFHFQLVFLYWCRSTLASSVTTISYVGCTWSTVLAANNTEVNYRLNLVHLLCELQWLKGGAYAQMLCTGCRR